MALLGDKMKELDELTYAPVFSSFKHKVINILRDQENTIQSLTTRLDQSETNIKGLTETVQSLLKTVEMVRNAKPRPSKEKAIEPFVKRVNEHIAGRIGGLIATHSYIPWPFEKGALEAVLSDLYDEAQGGKA
jgi:small-conductance mechanosensitive channel